MLMRPARVELRHLPSSLLAGNPLGDPAEREVAVVLPPGYDDEPNRRYPTVMFLAGFTGTGPALLNRGPWQEPLDQRFSRLVSTGKAKPAILILPDCFTRYGGSQYEDSPAMGRYQSFLVEEVLPFVEKNYRTVAGPEGRAVVGKSSGGYGALALVLDRPGLFRAAGSHAGDSAFDRSYQRELPRTVVALEKKGGIAEFLRWFESLPQKPGWTIDTMSHFACAAAWSPSASGPYGFGEGFDLPMDLSTGALRPDVWARWMARDPVERDLTPLKKLSLLFLDAGTSDEYFLQLGARQVAARAREVGVHVLHEEFDGGHMGTSYRYDRSLEILTAALDA
jgi:enterochelin esterase family protein